MEMNCRWKIWFWGRTFDVSSKIVLQVIVKRVAVFTAGINS